jgi:hypothetical protein
MCHLPALFVIAHVAVAFCGVAVLAAGCPPGYLLRRIALIINASYALITILNLRIKCRDYINYTCHAYGFQ